MALNPEHLETWKKKRRNTTAVFVFQSFILGIEYSVTFLTLWPYLKDLVKPSQPKAYFSFISAAYILGGLPIQLVLAKISDKQKCVQKLLTTCNCLLIVGNVIYSLPFSPWLLLCGRLIAGIGGSMSAIMTGELARVYEDNILFKKLSMMGMAYTSGIVVGPAINIMFVKVDFYIGQWHLNFENLPGIYLMFCFTVGQILVFVFVHDLSKEYDLKTHMKLIKDNEVRTIQKSSSRHHSSVISRIIAASAEYVIIEDKFENTTNEYSTPQAYNLDLKKTFEVSFNEQSSLLCNNNVSVFTTVKRLLTNLDCVVLFGVTFLGMYIIVTVDMWLPLLVLETIPNGNIMMMNLVVLGSAVVCAIGSTIIIFKKLSTTQSYVLAVVSLIMLAGIVSVFVVLSQYNTNQQVNILMWIIYCISFGFATTNVQIFCPGCLATLADSRIQTVTEGVRNSFDRFGALVALLTSALIFDYVVILSSIYIAIIALAVFSMILRRKILSQPRVIIH